MDAWQKPSPSTEAAHETTTGAAIRAQVEHPKADKETQTTGVFNLNKGKTIAFPQ